MVSRLGECQLSDGWRAGITAGAMVVAVGAMAALIFIRKSRTPAPSCEINGVVRMSSGGPLGVGGRVLPPEGFEVWEAAEWDEWLGFLNSVPFDSAAA